MNIQKRFKKSKINYPKQFNNQMPRTTRLKRIKKI